MIRRRIFLSTMTSFPASSNAGGASEISDKSPGGPAKGSSNRVRIAGRTIQGTHYCPPTVRHIRGYVLRVLKGRSDQMMRGMTLGDPRVRI